MANFTTPVGRLVMGSLTTPQTTDADGKPLLVKTGPNAGQPTQKFFIAVAIPKTPQDNGHWANTPWGAEIWKAGHASMPNQAGLPSFAWKVQDGDSQVPNKKGRKNCDTEGFAGCWVVFMQSAYAPKTYNNDGSAPLPATEIKPGYYVQVNATVDGNKSSQNPGVFINPNMVALAGYGPEIVFGPDPTAAGFGQAPLPAGASAVPLGGMPGAAPAPVAPAAPAVQGAAPAVQGAAPAPFVAPPAAVQAPAPSAPVAATPPASPAAPADPGFLQVPPPEAAPARVMLPPAGNISYEQYVAAGWTDAQLIQHGYMQA